jgi:N-acetylglucosaminyl-diphospho-decaprenol L-rhamnosyltransferase
VSESEAAAPVDVTTPVRTGVADVMVVVVSYNTADLLATCLRSLQAATTGALSVQTWVVDNASHDGSADLVARDFPAVHLQVNAHNAGFATACNAAIRQSTSRFILLLNPDAELAPGALETLVAFLDGHPQAAWCGPRLINSDGSHQPSARRFPTVWSTAYAMTGRALRHPSSRHTLDLHAQHGADKDMRVDWLTGACLLVRREATEQVGLMDEGYFLYFEELDWCRRLSDAGWQGWYVAGASARHHGGASVEEEDPARPFWGNAPGPWVASSRRYLRTHHGVVGLVISHAGQVLLHGLVWLKNCARRGEVGRDKRRTAVASMRYLLRR